MSARLPASLTPPPATGAARRRPAFTLVEMLVSMAVLTIVLSIVGVVFTITTRTTSQAAAHAQVENLLRQFTMQIEEDLRLCEPSKGILVIAGRNQAASLTADDLAADRYYRVLLGDPSRVSVNYDPAFDPNLDNGDPLAAQYSNPRADLLMFISNRPTVSQAPPDNPAPGGSTVLGELGTAALHGTPFSPILVLYGHAALADVDATTTPATWRNIRHIEQTTDGSNAPMSLSRIPAGQWCLARRASIIAHVANKLTFDNSGYYGYEWDRIMRYEARSDLNPQFAGDMAFLDLPLFLRGFEPDAALPYAEWPAVQSPYETSALKFTWVQRPSAWSIAGSPRISNVILSLMYLNAVEPNHHVATVLPEVPVALRSNLGLQILPGCVWFQVEFLMPEDPRNSLDYAEPDPTVGGYSSRADMPRWVSARPNETYLFVPDTSANREGVALAALYRQSQGSLVVDDRLYSFGRLDQDLSKQGDLADAVDSRVIRMWPYAIRITVRVYDRAGRLDQPIERSLVHRFD